MTLINEDQNPIKNMEVLFEWKNERFVVDKALILNTLLL